MLAVLSLFLLGPEPTVLVLAADVFPTGRLAASCLRTAAILWGEEFTEPEPEPEAVGRF